MAELLIIIQARMTSTRLPGKILMPIGDKPVLQIMIERLGNLKAHIVIATTNDGTEKPIIELCQKLDVKYFRGDTDNVLERYYLAAKQFGAHQDTAIMRLTSDCPLIDYGLVKQCITTYQENNYDMVGLGPHSGFPRGLDTCIFSFNLLQVTHKKAILPSDREHVTCGMAKFNNINSFVISAYEDLTQFRLTLDEPDDYTAICAVYQLFNHRVDFDYRALNQALKAHPEIAEINQHVEQKKV